MTKHIVVTGAGTGIGRAIAENLAQKGCTIILLGRNTKTLEETKSSLTRSDSHKSFSCDVRKPEEIRAALKQSGIDSLYGVVANAGVCKANIYGDNDCWQEHIDINLTGSYNSVQECLPYLRKDVAPYKKVVFMSSVLARIGAPAYTGYCASKTGMLGLMRSLAVELAPDKIIVNAICPSWVDTRMAQDVLEGMALALSISKEEAYQKAMSDIPLGKMSMPVDVARLTGFLMSDAETSITGQTFDINNGVLMV